MSSCTRRVVVIGTTSSGKTTFARRLAEGLALPHVEMDALYWEPDWTEAETQVFRDRIAVALSGDAWVVDGNYTTKSRDLVWTRATDIVWLDLPFWTKFLRLFRRTTRRVISQEELWSGNRERFRTAFMSRESLFVWLGKTHRKQRRIYAVETARPEYAHARILRINTARDAERLLQRMIAGEVAPAVTP